MKTYFREKHSRHLWSLECDEKGEWKTEYIQIGACLETEKALDLMLSFVAYNAETDKIQIPPPEFYEIKSHIGYSGCRDFYAQTGGHIRYDIIPGTDIIQEYKTPVKRIPLVYSSMNDKVNSGLTITQDTFWAVLQVYLQYFRRYEECDIENIVKWWGRRGYDTMNFQEVQDQGVEYFSEMGNVKFAPDNSFFIWNSKKIDIGYPYDRIFNEEEQNILSDVEFRSGGIFNLKNISHNWLNRGMLLIDNNKTDWIIVDRNGKGESPVENYPFFYVQNKFEKPEYFRVYFCTKDNVICLENQEFWTQFDQYFFNGFKEEELEKMIATLNEKMMREVIHLYKTERGQFPTEDLSKQWIKICIRDKSLPECKEIQIGCQTVLYYPEIKRLHWQDYNIEIDGDPVDFEPGYFNLIMDHKKKVSEALKKYDLKWMEIDGEIKFESIEIPF
jgi:hypothetical protein